MAADDIDALEAEADAPADGVSVELVTEAGEADIVVPPPGRWKTRAQTFLTQGAYDLWAQLTLSKDDFQAWRELDPTLDEATAFLEAWEQAAGQSLGKSRASRRSSRKTRKR